LPWRFSSVVRALDGFLNGFGRRWRRGRRDSSPFFAVVLDVAKLL